MTGDKCQVFLSIFFLSRSLFQMEVIILWEKLPVSPLLSHIILLIPEMCGFSTNFSIPAGCPAIQVSSDTNQSKCRPHRLGAQSPQDCPSLQCQLQVVGPQVIHHFWLQIRDAYNLLLGFSHLTEELTELRETLTFTNLLYIVVKDMIKDPDKKPDEEIHTTRSRRILSTEALSPLSWGAASPGM